MPNRFGLALAQFRPGAIYAPESPVPTTPVDYGYGPRWDEQQQAYAGAPKGLGFFGPLLAPDGRVKSEYSMGVDFGRGVQEIPTFVPTLTKAEVQHLLTKPDEAPVPPAIRDKAIAFARHRLSQGLDPFAQPGEQLSLYPDLPRAAIPTPR